MAKRSLGPLVLKFTCTGPCGQETQALKDSALELFRLCPACQAARFAAGERRKAAALAQEAAGGAR